MNSNIQYWFGIALMLVGQSSQTQSDFCQSRTPAALHSEKCPNAFVENDAGKIQDILIQHSPVYHTYSRWDLNGRTFVLAYWDRDNDPINVQADVYAATKDLNGESQYKKLLTIPAFETVDHVFARDLIGKGSEQLVVVSWEGQLEAVRIVQFNGDQARLVFDYAGTKIQFTDKAPYNILVYAKSTNLTELFQWSESRRRFYRVAIKPGFSTAQASSSH
jgi:hypothetical protein